MKKKIFKSVEIKIAVFAIVGLFLLVWGINFLKGLDIFKKQYSYYVVFENASGLLPSHLVTVNGLSVGIVDKIQLMPQNSNKILITINIDKNVEIPANSIARVASSNPLSSPQIEILFGNESQYLQDGDTIRSEIFAGLLDGLGEIMAHVKNIMISIDTSVNLLQKTLQSGALDNVEITLKNLRTTTDKIDNLLAVNSSKVNTIVADVQIFTNTLHKNDNKINEMIGNFNDISEKLAEAELKKTVNNAADAIGKLDSLLNKMNQGEGTLGQLMVNDSLYINLQNSLVSLDKLLIDIQKNPKKYINITVFEKKKKGVSGQ
jgi:phospholipid/cholesterol/gamma-HCH transport system substrate-binding protein